jgi:hypothetical protein
MNPFKELKDIAENQKTVRTSRLLPLVKEANRMYAESGRKINKQRKELDNLQRKQNKGRH